MILPVLPVYNKRKNCYNIGQFMKEVTQWVVIFANLRVLSARAI